MKIICNSCGREFDEGAQMYTHKTESGTEYTVCEECEKDGIEIVETTTYCVCSTCGFICEKEVFEGSCEFCGANEGFGEIELTQAEEHDFDTDKLKIYEEKLGRDFADKISAWKDSEAKKKVDEAGKTLEDAERKNLFIQRKLKNIESIDTVSADKLLFDETDSVDI